jgi:broad specificity phosphatase PhoE
MQLYLIRHGQSANNALETSAGRSQDPPLTDLGIRQAEILAAHLAEALPPKRGWESSGSYQFDHLYCSAMQRALQTAAPIGKALGLKPEVWTDIHEQGGIYLDEPGIGRTGLPGLTLEMMQEQFPDYMLPDTVTSAGWWNRDYETEAAAAGRAIAVAERLMDRRASGERIAIMTHHYFMHLLIKALLHQLPSPEVSYSHYNTGITRIDIEADARLRLRYLNRVNHLPVELLS